MKINVAQQLKSYLGDTRQYAVSDTTEEGFSITGEAKLVLTNRSILATGRFNTVITTTCSRCLDEFDHPLDFELSEEFFPTGNILSPTPTPKDEIQEADGFTIGEDHVLDLGEALHQNIVLSLPTKPICKPDCAGLCQKCGQNLNDGQCECPKEESDPRWSPLKQLLSDQIAESVREVNKKS